MATRWAFAKKNNNQLKKGKLITATDKEFNFNYEEITPRSYQEFSDIINGATYIKSLMTFFTSNNIPFSVDGVIQSEEGIKYTIKQCTPKVDSKQSRYGTNILGWTIYCGQ